MRSLVLICGVLALASTSAHADGPSRLRLLTHSTTVASVQIARETKRTRAARAVQLRVVAHEEPMTAQPLPITERLVDDEGAPMLMKNMRSQIYASLPSVGSDALRFSPTVMAIPSADGSLVGAGILGRF